MNRVEELIRQLCPNGVEWKKLGEVCLVTIGEFVHKNKQSDTGKYPVYNGGISYTGFYDEFNNTGNKIIISARGANAGYVNRVFCNYWAGNSCYSLSVITGVPLDWTFLFYYLKNRQSDFTNIQQKGGIPAVSKNQICDFEIPIPPLPIQQEIVNILDTFTELTTNLQTELDARKKQYAYYRDCLLNFEGVDGVEWKKLGEIGRIFSGKNNQRKESGRYPVYGSTGIIAYSDTYSYDKNQILIARVGVNAGYTYVAHGKYDVSDNTLVVDVNERFNLKYIFYILVNVNLNAYAKGGGQPLITAGEVKKITIPIPPLSEQRRIVAILDQFETLVNDQTIGLPAELNARRKQYEYYRDKLLTFNRV